MQKFFKFSNLPNYLTLFRIFLIPFIVGSFYFHSLTSSLIGFSLFVIACITDFIDGYIARRFHLISNFGRMFDPIADKFLIVSTLFMFVSVGKANVIACLIIVAREFLISGFREFLAQSNVNVKVIFFSKVKTTVQMIALSLKFLCLAGSSVFLIGFFSILSEILLWVAAFLTVWTAVYYFIIYNKYFEI